MGQQMRQDSGLESIVSKIQSDGEGEGENGITATFEGLREQTRAYWIMSRAWRGDPEFAPRFNVGQLITSLGTLQMVCLHKSSVNPRLLMLVHHLLQSVVMGKRCRKRKPVNNLVQLSDLRIARETKNVGLKSQAAS